MNINAIELSNYPTMSELKEFMAQGSKESADLWIAHDKFDMLMWGSVVLAVREGVYDLTIASSTRPKTYEHTRYMLQCLVKLCGGFVTLRTRGMAMQAVRLLESSGHKIVENKSEALFVGKVKVFTNNITIKAPDEQH